MRIVRFGGIRSTTQGVRHEPTSVLTLTHESSEFLLNGETSGVTQKTESI
jgi:hypothetical protein